MKKDNRFTEDYLESCEEHIKNIWGESMTIKLLIKPFLTGIFPEVPKDYTGEEEDLTAYAKMCNKVLTDAVNRKLRKDTDENIYKVSDINQLHYEVYNSYTEYLEEVFAGDN
jgi:hypothetical protein